MAYLVALVILTLALSCCASQPPTHGHGQPQPQPQPIWIRPYIIDYRNGTVLRDAKPTFVAAPNNSQVRAKDITIPLSSSSVHYFRRARIFLPARLGPTRKIPILIYFHGGAFCIGSPFSRNDTVYLARVAARAKVIAISVDYRLYPEFQIPAPYDDAWAPLNWVWAHSGSDPWLAQYGDLGRVYVGGDSAGGNIAHNLAIRVGLDPFPNRVKLAGVFLAMPYFLGSKRVPLEPETIVYSPNYKIWDYVCPNCSSGVDNGFINPFGPGAPALAGLGCERLLVYTAEIDELRGRGVWYYKRVRVSGWKGKARWVEAQGKGHVFHIMDPEDPATTRLIQDLSSFINS